jgi:hypothetical protein
MRKFCARKADVVERTLAFDRVNLLQDEPPVKPGLLFISSSDN